MITIDISVPGRVWLDFLDPYATGMQDELGLPEGRRVKAGKGFRVVYKDVPQAQANQLARYLRDRGDMLLGQGIDDPYDPMEKAARDTLRAGIRMAAKIREDETRARVLAGTSAGIIDAGRLA